MANVVVRPTTIGSFHQKVSASRPYQAQRTSGIVAPGLPLQVAQRPNVGARNTPRHSFNLGRALAIAALVVLLTAFGQALPWPAANATNDQAEVTFQYVTVYAGDTLWGMAEKYAPQADPRDWISQVVEINNLGSASVQAGSKLAIPAK